LLVLLLLALIAQALGWWAIFTSLKKVEASRAGLILLLQPILATIWGVLFFAEHLAWTQMLGGVVTLAAIYVGLLRESKTGAAPPAAIGSV
ncbi:MAG: EamA family transporter, partial [bacterium]